MERHAILGLAREALLHRLDDDVAAAHAAVQRIGDEHGPEAVAGAMIAWATTALRAAGVTNEPGGLRSIAFRNVETGVHTTADETPPPVRWGGRFLIAVLERDEDQLTALFNSVQDERESTLNVITLLSMCAIAITDGIERFDGTVADFMGRLG